MLTIESVTDLKFANESGTFVTAMVKFSEFAEPMPYCIGANDTEPHGKELYEQVFVKKMYTVAAYVAPPVDPAIVERKALRDSAIAKLKALGLTEDEALSLI
jgi:hypothetical protein